MKNKTLGLFVLSILALTFVVGAVSAAFVVSPSSVSKTISSGTTSVSFDNILVNNDGLGGNYSLTWSGTTRLGVLVFPTLTPSIDGNNHSTSFSLH